MSPSIKDMQDGSELYVNGAQNSIIIYVKEHGRVNAIQIPITDAREFINNINLEIFHLDKG